MINISILGAGNVAQHLYTTFLQQESVKIIQCYNRKGITLHKNQDKNQITSNIKDLKKADIYILAVTDDAIDRISQELPFTGRLVVHTSGSVPMGMLDSKNNRGVFYPLQTFSKDKEVDFTKVPFCIEAENKTDMHTLKKLAFLLSNKIYEISSEQRNILHVSAVFVNNFTNHLYTIANQICTSSFIRNSAKSNTNKSQRSTNRSSY